MVAEGQNEAADPDVARLEVAVEPDEDDDETEEGSTDPGDVLSAPVEAAAWLLRKGVQAAKALAPEDDPPEEGTDEEEDNE